MQARCFQSSEFTLSSRSQERDLYSGRKAALAVPRVMTLVCLCWDWYKVRRSVSKVLDSASSISNRNP